MKAEWRQDGESKEKKRKYNMAYTILIAKVMTKRVQRT